MSAVNELEIVSGPNDGLVIEMQQPINLESGMAVSFESAPEKSINGSYFVEEIRKAKAFVRFVTNA